MNSYIESLRYRINSCETSIHYKLRELNSTADQNDRNELKDELEKLLMYKDTLQKCLEEEEKDVIQIESYIKSKQGALTRAMEE